MNTPVPPGFKFNPTDQELIWHYLYKKVNGKPLPCNAIIDCDIYGSDGSWRKMFEDRQEEYLHFFTRLRNLRSQRNDSSSRVVRATKFGTWRGQSDMKIYAGNKHIGSKRTFSFIEQKKKEEEPMIQESKKTKGWTMHEYRLDGCLMHRKEQHSSDYGYVVSRISRPRHMRRDGGESISSLIKCELDVLFPEELKQDSNKFEGAEMLPDDNLEVGMNDEWLSYLLEDNDPDSFSFLSSTSSGTV